MTCRKCNHEFCWLCLANWRGHSGCGVFTDEKKDDTEDRRQLVRFAHYCDRFAAHGNSQRFEKAVK